MGNDGVELSFCITCKGRLHHIKQTLLSNLEVAREYFPRVEFVLIDYDSGDFLMPWVKRYCGEFLREGVLRCFSSAISLRYFHMSHAKNVAHSFARGSILCNLDADNFIQDSLLRVLFDVFTRAPSSIVYGLGCASGRIAITKENFVLLGGYDEAMEGWGWDDLDFFKRAVGFLRINPVLVEGMDLFLRHSSKERLENYKVPSLDYYWLRNGRIHRGNMYFKRYVANLGKPWGAFLVKE